MSKEMEKHDTIEQELEAGLRKRIHYDDKGDPDGTDVTRIFLPKDKYEELERTGTTFMARLGFFHDIPVFSVNGDDFTEILYCTD